MPRSHDNGLLARSLELEAGALSPEPLPGGVLSLRSGLAPSAQAVCCQGSSSPPWPQVGLVQEEQTPAPMQEAPVS